MYGKLRTEWLVKKQLSLVNHVDCIQLSGMIGNALGCLVSIKRDGTIQNEENRLMAEQVTIDKACDWIDSNYNGER